jgi:hypothetical protein
MTIEAKLLLLMLALAFTAGALTAFCLAQMARLLS